MAGCYGWILGIERLLFATLIFFLGWRRWWCALGFINLTERSDYRLRNIAFLSTTLNSVRSEVGTGDRRLPLTGR